MTFSEGRKFKEKDAGGAKRDKFQPKKIVKERKPRGEWMRLSENSLVLHLELTNYSVHLFQTIPHIHRY